MLLLCGRLANPIADLISLPVQFNFDQNIGPVDKGERVTVNIQPVVPIKLTPEWLAISRTILPVIWQEDIFPGAGSQFGIGDILQSVFIAPVAPVSGWILGAGPVFLFPTGSDDLLTTDEWGAGATGVALRQDGPWTYGGLVNHIWSIGGSGNDISSTFLQPFGSYTTPQAWTFTLQMENSYDWKNKQWSAPLGAFVSKAIRIGSQPMSLAGGLRYYTDSFTNGPEGFGFRTVITLLFPK